MQSFRPGISFRPFDVTRWILAREGRFLLVPGALARSQVNRVNECLVELDIIVL